MYNLLKSANGAIVKVLNWLMIFLLSGMVVVIVMQVFWRYVLRQPLSWSEEVAKYFFSGVTLFGAAVLFRESKHISMSLLHDFIKKPFYRNLLQVVTQLICLIFLVIVIYHGFPMAKMIIDFDVLSPSMEWLKMGWVFMMLPVASLLSLSMLLEVIMSTVKTLKTGEVS